MIEHDLLLQMCSENKTRSTKSKSRSEIDIFWLKIGYEGLKNWVTYPTNKSEKYAPTPSQALINDFYRQTYIRGFTACL